MNLDQKCFKRNRLIRFFLIIIVICLGLFSRKMKDAIPEIVNIFLGDALWALMIFLIIGMVFNKWTIKKVGITSLAFCYLVELSQLYHAEWIDNIRSTTLGGLVLGYGFLWSDLLAYGIGIGFAILVEWKVQVK